MPPPPPPLKSALGFVDLDAHATSVVGAAAKIRARYGQGDGGPIVIPLFSNHGFMPFLRNLICSMRRLHVNNWLVIAMDNQTCPTLMGTPGDGEQSACVYPYSHSATSVTSDTKVATYRSVNFNRMVMQRPLWVRFLLQQGYSVIQCDLDIVWIKDPQPLLRSKRLKRHKGAHAVYVPRTPDGAGGAGGMVASDDSSHKAEGGTAARPDMLFQSEQAYGLNGGFYFVRPSKPTFAFFDAWVERLTVMIAMPSFEEQHALNSAIRRVKTYAEPERLSYEPLHDLHFPNGKIWWSYPWEVDKRRAYIVHANWNKQQKKSRLARDGLWFLTPDDKQCDSGFDPMTNGCSKMCYPIAYAAPGGKPSTRSCADMNRADDSISRKFGTKWANSNWTKPPNVHGLLWHPMAYAAKGDCKRDLSKVVPHAQMLFDKVARERWTPDAHMAANGSLPTR